jgi:hypothetical protein
MLTQLGEWTRLGFFTRTGFGTYRLNMPPSEIPRQTRPILNFAALLRGCGRSSLTPGRAAGRPGQL